MDYTQTTPLEQFSNNTNADAGTTVAFSASRESTDIVQLMAPGSATEVPHMAQTTGSGAPASTPDDMMKRPKLIRSALPFVNGSTAVLTVLSPGAAYMAGLIPNMTGVAGFRCTMVYRVEVAAAPQVSGLLKASVLYLPTYSGPNLYRSDYRPIAAQLPGPYLNIADGASMELRVPFKHCVDYFYMNNNIETTLGHRFSLNPILPVTWDTTTTSSPSVSVYVWVEDVETIGASTPLITATPQSGAEARISKPSEWFSGAAKVATISGALMPLLSSYTRPLSWLFGQAANTAAHFGYSKPYIGSYGSVMGNSMVRGHNTCADQDQLQPMAMYSNNEVASLPGFAGTSVDEMSICYLTCLPGLLAVFKLNPADAAGTLKWACPVTPGTFGFQTSATGGFLQAPCCTLGTTSAVGTDKAGYFPTPINFVSSYFSRWRGDLIFRFRFATTKFHAGKLVIGYAPAEDPPNGPVSAYVPTFNASRYDYPSAVIDLRSCNQYDLEVPFTYNRDWAYTNAISGRSSAYHAKNTGTVFVYVVDPLYGPDNVSQFCWISVEVFSKCGLEFSQPRTSQLIPLDMTNPITVVAQMAGEISAYTSGESIKSLKQLAMRPMWQYFGITGPDVSIPQANLNYYKSASFIASAGSYNLPSEEATAANNYAGQTIISRLSCLYALHRGSVTVRMLPSTTASGVQSSFASSAVWTDISDLDYRYAPLSMECRMANQMRLPYYSANNRELTGWVSGTAYPNDRGTLNTLDVNYGGTDQSSFLLGVAAGDDYQAGLFIGVPACVVIDNGTVQDRLMSFGTPPPP